MNEQIIYKFLSRLADQYRKDAYWIKNFKELYIAAFAKVPSRFLEGWLQDYLVNHMPQWCPTITAVKEFVRAKPMSREEWFLADRGVYCEHCRSIDDGSDGGHRILDVKYYSQIQQKEIRTRISAQCDCSASQGTGRVYTETIRAITEQDPNATIHYDYWDFDRGCKVSAVHQSDQMWEHRVKHGYIKIEEQGEQRYYVPVWENEIWETSMGRVIAKTIGWDLPEDVLDRRAKRQAKRNRSDKKNKKHLLSDSAVDAIFSHYDY